MDRTDNSDTGLQSVKFVLSRVFGNGVAVVAVDGVVSLLTGVVSLLAGTMSVSAGSARVVSVLTEMVSAQHGLSKALMLSSEVYSVESKSSTLTLLSIAGSAMPMVS